MSIETYEKTQHADNQVVLIIGIFTVGRLLSLFARPQCLLHVCVFGKASFERVDKFDTIVNVQATRVK